METPAGSENVAGLVIAVVRGVEAAVEGISAERDDACAALGFASRLLNPPVRFIVVRYVRVCETDSMKEPQFN